MFWCLSCLCETSPAVLTTSPRCSSCLWRKCSRVVCRQSWCTSCRCLPRPKCTDLRQTYLWRNMIWRMLPVVMIPLSKFLAKRYADTVGEDQSFFWGGEVVRSNCHVPKFCVILLLQLPCLLLSWWPHSGVGVTESIIMKDRLCSSCYFWVRMCLLQDEIIIFYSVACTVRFVWVLCVCDMGQPDSFLPSSWLHFQLSMLLRSFQFHCEKVFLSVLPDGFRGHHWCQGHRKCSIFDLYSTVLHYCDLRLS